jgi:hypothetical protein
MRVTVSMTSKIRTYNELQRLTTFDDRYAYLRLAGMVGTSTFGFDRYLNQVLYSSSEWLRARDEVLVRDNGCDLGLIGYELRGRIIVHHMNPISIEDIENRNLDILNPKYLICTSHNTHLAIHFGDKSLLPELPIIRRPGDTSPWRQNLKEV